MPRWDDAATFSPAAPMVSSGLRSFIRQLLLPVLLSGVLPLTNAHALPPHTTTAASTTVTIDLHSLDVLNWPLQPTPAPTQPPNDLRRRDFNTVCGYIGGDPALPATCSAGSHCVVDVNHGAIGCCPDGGTCSQGIFTGCVDGNSGPQTEVNPYVYTCGGGDVCYKNVFDGGYFQYGCGSTSALAATVAVSASGQDPLTMNSLSAAFTATPVSLSESTTIGSGIFTASPSGSSTSVISASATSALSSSLSTSTSSSSLSTSSHSTSTLESQAASTSTSYSSTSTSLATAAPSSDGHDSTNTAAIIGGTVGGVVALAILLIIAFLLWRRKRRNARQGPGLNQETKYISPTSYGGHRFAPLAPVIEADESELPRDPPPTLSINSTHRGDHTPPSTYEVSSVSDEPMLPPYHPTDQSGRDHDQADAMAYGGSQMNTEPDRVPLTKEIDDFSRGFNSALGDIHEDDTPASNSASMAQYPGRRGRNGGGPLWHQNRRQSRNLMWM